MLIWLGVTAGAWLARTVLIVPVGLVNSAVNGVLVCSDAVRLTCATGYRLWMRFGVERAACFGSS